MRRVTAANAMGRTPRPELQRPKRSKNGQWNVRYRNGVKRLGVDRLQELIAAHAPWLRVRYAF